VTNEVLERSEGLDLLVTYHPLLFGKVNRLIAGAGPASAALSLIRKGVSLAVVHTAWDAAPGGTSDCLASAIELTDTRKFGLIEPAMHKKLVTFVPSEALEAVSDALIAAGAGTVGRYRGCSFRSEGLGTFTAGERATPTVGRIGEREDVEEVRLEMVVAQSGLGPAVSALLATHPYEEPAFDIFDATSNAGMIGRVGIHQGSLESLRSLVVERFGPSRISIPDPIGNRRSESSPPLRVAVVPGSGGTFVGEAKAAGASAFVTGDLSHYQTKEALDLGLATFDVGHARSEQPGVKALFDLVAKMVPEAMDLTFDPTPWR
jgi:putative NIF3 family GTP cyclohydrolase 1 type 2